MFVCLSRYHGNPSLYLHVIVDNPGGSVVEEATLPQKGKAERSPAQVRIYSQEGGNDVNFLSLSLFFSCIQGVI